MNNTEFKVNELSEITEDLFKKVIGTTYLSDHNSFAPLGCSGDTFIIHQLDEQKSRPSQVSFRKYCGDVELLITNRNGAFLFYGRYDTSLFGLERLAEEYFKVFNNVKHLILENSEDSKMSEEDLEKMAEEMHRMRAVGFII